MRRVSHIFVYLADLMTLNHDFVTVHPSSTTRLKISRKALETRELHAYALLSICAISGTGGYF
jgi:hypothetical protein